VGVGVHGLVTNIRKRSVIRETMQESVSKGESSEAGRKSGE
jgi:hypothetical protein